MTTEVLYSYFQQCGSVSTDTRKIIPGSLFFALKGDKFNANAFAAEALSKGAKFAVIDDESYKAGDQMLLVNDALASLQELARYHRRQLGLPVIALTGSNGKTTTKELINAVLSKKYNTKATAGNLNNHIGVPLTLLSFDNETEIGIVEMGANHQKEIEFLCSIAEPNFGYITNFGKAHLEGFGGVEGVIKGKSELYNYLQENTKTAFVNLDDKIQKEKTENLPRFAFSSLSYNCDLKISKTEANPMVVIEYNGVTINSNLIGIYNAANISAAIAIGSYFKVSDKQIKEAIEEYIPANNRSQLMEWNGNRIILDAYNANPSSMMAAIDNFSKLEGINKIAILGDMFELGNDSINEHKKIVESVEDTGIETYFIGKDFYTSKLNNPQLKFYKSYDDFSREFKSFSGKTVLIKGSRGMALEKVLELI
jgi:UDP-N-acetylmuramoyl-tripeptide--D-alanyl-D-alanine ligase